MQVLKSIAKRLVRVASRTLGMRLKGRRVRQDMEAPFIFRSFMNSFRYLYRDAEELHSLARKEDFPEGFFSEVRLCRIALLMYILSLEGLINRAMDHFLPERVHDYFLDREDRLNFADKWQLLPLLAGGEKGGFDKSKYPWNQFAELISIRNDFVHPKHDREVFYRVVTSHNWQTLLWNEIPEDFELEGKRIRETDLAYRQTRIPKDPSAIRIEHVDTVKKVVDDIIDELDGLLGGVIKKDDWYNKDQMELVYPPGARLSDLPKNT